MSSIKILCQFVCIIGLLGCLSNGSLIIGNYHYECAVKNCRSPRLKLKKNHRFVYSEPPLFESKKRFHQKGNWSYVNDTLTLRFYEWEFFNDLHYTLDSSFKVLAFKQDTFGWMIKWKK